MGGEDTKRDGLSYWIRVGIWLGLSFAGWFLPPGDIITAYGMKIAFIFVGLMFGWICLDLIYPSFFGGYFSLLCRDRQRQCFVLRRIRLGYCGDDYRADNLLCICQQGGTR